MPQGYHLESSPPKGIVLIAAVSPLLGPNDRRHSIVFGVNAPFNTVAAIIFPGDGQLQNGIGFTISGGKPIEIVRYDDWGPIIFQPWSGTILSAAPTITIIETFWVKD